MLNNNEKIKIAILEISDQNKAVLEYYFSTAGKSFYQEANIDDADAFITDYDYPGAVEHWDELVKTTHKPGIILSISEKQIPSAIWLAKPLAAKAMTEAAAQIAEMLTAEPPVVTIEVETLVTETVESESPVADLVEPEITVAEPILEEKAESESPVADLVESEITVAEPILEEKADEELSFEEILIQDMSANQQPAIEEQLVADTQEKSNKLNKNLNESFEKIFDNNDYQAEETPGSEITGEIEFEALAGALTKEQQQKKQTQPDKELAMANDASEHLSVEDIAPDPQESKKQAIKAAEITEVSLEVSTEATDAEEIDALLQSLIQGKGRKKKPEVVETNTENKNNNSITGLSLEELSLEIEQADTAEQLKDTKDSIDANTLQLNETQSLSDFPTLEEPKTVQDPTASKVLNKIEDSLPSLKSKAANKAKAVQAAKKIKAAQAAQKVRAVKAAQALKKVRAAKAAQAAKQSKSVRKSVIVEEFVRVEGSAVAEENTFAETLEVNAPKDNQAKAKKIKPVPEKKEQHQDPLTTTFDDDLGADLLDFDFDSLVSDENQTTKKAVVEDDGAQLNLIDARNAEQSDLEELVVDKDISIEKTPNLEATSNNELEKLLDESAEFEKSFATPTPAPVVDKNAKKNAEQELQALLNEIRVEAEKSSSGKKPDSSKFTYGDYPAADSSPSTVHDKTNAEKRWSTLCGENKDITSVQETKEISFTLNKHMLSVLLDQLDHATGNSKQLLRLKYDDIVIVIDYAEDTIYCNYSVQSSEFSDYCYTELKPENIRVHDLDYSEVNLYRKKMMVENENSHSIESFVWTTSLLTSRGRLLQHTDITKRIGLKTWPNLTRLELIPHAMNVAAVLSKHPGSLKDIPKWLNIPQRYVFAFYNAALSLDMIELDSRNFKLSTFSFNPKTTPEKITKDRGFFGRLLKRLTT